MYRFGNSLEDNCIRKIEAGIRALKNGSKIPEQTKCGFFLAKLKPLNEGMYDDLLQKYKKAKETYDSQEH
jgi:hypothetical protein